MRVCPCAHTALCGSLCKLLPLTAEPWGSDSADQGGQKGSFLLTTDACLSGTPWFGLNNSVIDGPQRAFGVHHGPSPQLRVFWFPALLTLTLSTLPFPLPPDEEAEVRHVG